MDNPCREYTIQYLIWESRQTQQDNNFKFNKMTILSATNFNNFAFTASPHKTKMTDISLSPKAFGTKSAVSTQNIKDEYVPSALVSVKPRVSFKPPSFLADSFKMPKASDLMQPQTKNLNGLSPEGIITRTLEAHGIKLKDGDVLSMTLNGKGELSIDANSSSIGGATGDAISELCDMLSGKLNEAKTGNGETLSKALLKQLATDTGFDLGKGSSDPDSSVSFSFKYNSKAERSEIAKAKQNQMNSPALQDVAPEAEAVNQNVQNVQANSEPPLTIAPVSESAVGVRGTTDAEGNTLVSILEESNGHFSSFADIRRWERDNNFSFRTVEGAPPLTPEEKKHYNEMLRKALSEGIQPLQGYKSSFNRVEGTDWLIADGAEALVGHKILSVLENGMFAKSDGAHWNAHGPVNPRINEYGFTIDMPASYNGVSYLHGDLVSPGGTTKKVPILGMDGGQTYAPEIHFRDALGLGGMSLADRKLFLELTQSILDNVMPGMDARQLTYTTGYLTEADLRNNKLSLTLTDVAWLSTAQRNTLEQALNQNRQLFEMKHRADQSSNKGLGEFTMSVLDANGNALAKDQVRLIAGNKSIITSVDSIKNMNQQQIFAFINR